MSHTASHAHSQKGRLYLFCPPALQEASSLSVQQGPNLLQVRQGSQATLVCQVDQAPAWERLRVKWTKDGAILCQPYITNGSLSLGVCGPQGRLSWQAPSHLTLQLDPVNLNHSGAYVCWAAVEIPELEEAESNITRLFVDPGTEPAGRGRGGGEDPRILRLLSLKLLETKNSKFFISNFFFFFF